jgi:hypothetical protein
MLMWRNSEIEAKKRDAPRDADPTSDIRSNDDAQVKEEVEDRREMDDRGSELPDSKRVRRGPPNEFEPDL